MWIVGNHEESAKRSQDVNRLFNIFDPFKNLARACIVLVRLGINVDKYESAFAIGMVDCAETAALTASGRSVGQANFMEYLIRARHSRTTETGVYNFINHGSDILVYTTESSPQRCHVFVKVRSGNDFNRH